jgi:hypothetical protein
LTIRFFRGVGSNRTASTVRSFSLLNTIARGGDGRFCCVGWVVAVAGPLVDLAASVSFCLPGIPGAFQLKGRGHRQVVAGAELAKVQVVLGGSAPLLSATVRTHSGDVGLLDPAGRGLARRHPWRCAPGSRPSKTVGDQLFGRRVVLRRRQVRIIRAQTAPRRTAAVGYQAAQVHRFTVHGLDYGCREQW